MGRETIATIAAAVALVTLVGVGLSLSLPLLSLEMERMGISGGLIGLNTAIAGAAGLLVIPFVPQIAASIGVGRLIGASIAVTALSFLAFRLVPSYLAWFPIRFVFSAGIGALFVLSEYWIAEKAPPHRRGVVMAAYGTSLALGFGAGPLLLALAGTTGWTPYLVAAALYLAALVPLALARRRLPALTSKPQQPVLRYLLAAPLVTAAGFSFGAIETGAFALLPVQGLRLGLASDGAALLVSAMALGNVLFQLPLGWLADRRGQARVLKAVALLSTLGALAIPVAAGAGPEPLMALLFVWGGIVGAVYPLGLALLANRFTGADLAGANAAFVVLYNLGLILGPPVAGASLDAAPDWGFALALAGFSALIVAAGRLRR